MARKKYVRGSDPVYRSQQEWASRGSRSPRPSEPSPALRAEEPRAAVYGPQRESRRAEPAPSPVQTRGSAKVHVNRYVLEWAATGKGATMDQGYFRDISPAAAQKALDKAIDAGAELSPGAETQVRTPAYGQGEFGERQEVWLRVLRRRINGDIYVEFATGDT
jgi:hypothetical protein